MPLFSITTGASPHFPQLISSQLIIQKAAVASSPFILRAYFQHLQGIPKYITQGKRGKFLFCLLQRNGKKRGEKQACAFSRSNQKGDGRCIFPRRQFLSRKIFEQTGSGKMASENFPIFGIYRISKCGNLMHRMTSEVRGKHTFLCMNRN